MRGSVLIAGPGAVGTVLAIHLYRRGHPVILAARDARRARLLAERGLTLIDDNGVTNVRFPVVPLDTREPPAVAFVCVCVKARDTADFVRAGARLLRVAGQVVSMQNGFGNTETLGRVTGPLVGATPGFGATRLSEHETRLAGLTVTHVAPVSDAAADAAHAWVGMLRDSGLPARFHASFETIRWSKLAINAAINAVSAINGVPNGAIMATPEPRDSALAAVAEAAAVARAQGIALIYDDPAAELRRVCRATAANRSSMLQDVEAHRETEVDAINGAVVSRGRELGIPTPINEALLHAVKALRHR